MDIRISKSKLCGEVKIPASKSISHRSIICAALSDSISRIDNVIYSDDILATIDVMKILGARFELNFDSMIVYGIGKDIDNTIKGYQYDNRENIIKDRQLDNTEDVIKDCQEHRVNFYDAKASNSDDETVVNVRESGSTFRFLIPLLAMMNRDVRIKTEGRLIKRPMKIYYDIFEQNGIEYKIEDRDLIILKKTGVQKAISPGIFKIDGNVSSQFISGLMFLLPMLNGDSEIEILGELESKSYVDLTIDCLQKFCVKVDNFGYKKFVIKGNQRYISTGLALEGDYSQFAFFYVAKALGSNLDIMGVDENSLQGDRKIVDIVDNYNKDKSYSFDGCNVVDIVPIISLYASVVCDSSRIFNISRLRMKESDRIEAVCDVLKNFGVNISSDMDSIYIKGGDNYLQDSDNAKKNDVVVVSSHGDHRIAMTVAIAATVCDRDVVLKDAHVVSKSYPNFWDEYKRLGAKFDVI